MEEPIDSEEHEKYPSVKEVTDEQRIGIVKEIFATVTGRYDFLNHFLSMRRDVFWRRFTVRKMHFFKTRRLLDVATGTADLAIDAARQHPSIRVTGVDFVNEMLQVGQAKIMKKGLSERIRLVQGDALCLPFPGQHLRRCLHGLRHQEYPRPDRRPPGDDAGGGPGRERPHTRNDLHPELVLESYVSHLPQSHTTHRGEEVFPQSPRLLLPG